MLLIMFSNAVWILVAIVVVSRRLCHPSHPTSAAEYIIAINDARARTYVCVFVPPGYA